MVKGGMILEIIFNLVLFSKTEEKKMRENDLVQFFEDVKKMKIPSEITQPLNPL